MLQKCNQIIGQREKIPGAPLWHMGKVAVFESQQSYDLLQNSVDYLTCKAQQNKPFTNDEKEFMKELFEALWWGGQYHGYRAAAKLADHYVNGNGKTIRIDENVYKDSVIVKDTIDALKKYISLQAFNNKTFMFLTTNDPFFLVSSQASELKLNKRNIFTQGYLLDNGALLAEQNNMRLKNTDHRFFIEANTTKSRTVFISSWSVKSVYDFEPFSSKNYITEIPLTQGFILKMPDGLSQHLTHIGVTKNFNYFAEWTETWG